MLLASTEADFHNSGFRRRADILNTDAERLRVDCNQPCRRTDAPAFNRPRLPSIGQYP